MQNTETYGLGKLVAPFHLLISHCIPRNELRQLSVPLSCPWTTNPFKQEWFDINVSKKQEYLTPLAHAVAVPFKAYIVWLLRSGGASLSDMISVEHNMLDAIMRSRSLDMIRFFFKGPQSFEDEYNSLSSPANGICGGSEVLRLFFRANYAGPKVSSAFLYPLKAFLYSPDTGEKEDSTKSWDHPEDWWGENNMEKDSDRILNCYLYLLRQYPDAKIPLEAPFFKVLIRDVDKGVRGLWSRSTDLNLTRIKDEHEARLRNQIPEHQLITMLLRYVTTSAADDLSGEDLATVMSFLPGISLRHFLPGIFWVPTQILWLCAASSILWTIWVSFVKAAHNSITKWPTWRRTEFDDDTDGRLTAEYRLLRLFVAFFLTVFIIFNFLICIFALSSIRHGISNIFPLRKFAQPIIWPFVFLVASLIIPATLTIFLNTQTCIMLIKMRQGFSVTMKE